MFNQSRPYVNRFWKQVLALVTAIFIMASAARAHALTINEIRIASPGNTDNTSNFFELAGDPQESLDGLTFLALSGEFQPGLINSATDLTGSLIPDDGFFLAATELTEYGDATDLATGVDFFASPATFLLVNGFSGTEGDDLDADNNGLLDATPWTGILDAVSVFNSTGNPDISYGGPVLINATNFVDSHIERYPDGTGGWGVIGSFEDRRFDTPGVSNRTAPKPGDFDASTKIDGTDFLLWQREETDSDYRAQDYGYWQDAYGFRTARIQAVPEPGALSLLLFSVFFMRSRNQCGKLATS